MAYKIINCGDHRKRRSFSRIKNTYELKDLLEIQKKSYQRFLEEGIKEVFEDLFPVESFTGNISLELGDYYFEEPRYTVKEGAFFVFRMIPSAVRSESSASANDSNSFSSVCRFLPLFAKSEAI